MPPVGETTGAVEGAAASRRRRRRLPTELWTLRRIGEVVRKRFDVRYSEVGIWALLRHSLGWSWQKPERRALQRDEAAIAPWKRNEWPRLKKHRAPRRPLAFLDESGFLLIPNVRKTWAPVGHTPHVRHSYRRDRVSVISALTVAPRRRRLGLYFDLHGRNITAPRPSRFFTSCSVISAARSSCCGTAGRFIGVGTCSVFSAAIPGCRRIASRATHRSSIPTNSSGRRPSANSRTSITRGSSRSRCTSCGPFNVSADRRSCFAHASTRPISRGRNPSRQGLL
jgi:winged helix-turn-helix protein/DDE superfamily endonuclease